MNVISIKSHPTLGVSLRSDGAVYLEGNNNRWKPHWSYGWRTKDGYRKVKIGKKKYSVHRLIAEAFLDNPENKPTVDHINRIRDDNRVENLRWATMSEQLENNGIVLDRDNRITVREKDDPNSYRRQYNELHREEYRKYQREYARNRCAKHKEIQLCAQE